MGRRSRGSSGMVRGLGASFVRLSKQAAGTLRLGDRKQESIRLARGAGLYADEACMMYTDRDYIVRYVSPSMVRAGWRLSRAEQARDLNNAVGNPCYRALRGRDRPCPDCVIHEAGRLCCILSRIAWEAWGGPTHIYTIPDYMECGGRFVGVLEVGFPVTDEAKAREDQDFLDLLGEGASQESVRQRVMSNN